MTQPFTTLSSADLERTLGGAGENAAVCTPENPSGARQPTQFLEQARPAAPRSELPNPAHYDVFTRPKDLAGKSKAIVDAFK